MIQDANANLTIVPGVPVNLKIRAKNDLDWGYWSDTIVLTPSALPSGPANIYVTYNIEGTLRLDWDVPLDTGGSDAIAVDPLTLVYMLEVDEGFLELNSS